MMDEKVRKTSKAPKANHLVGKKRRRFESCLFMCCDTMKLQVNWGEEQMAEPLVSETSVDGSKPSAPANPGVSYVSKSKEENQAVRSKS